MAKAKKSKKRQVSMRDWWRTRKGPTATPAAAKPAAGHWERNLFYNPERERRRLAEEIWTGRPQLPQEPPLIWAATPQGKAGRRPSLTAGQIKRGRSLLRKRLREGPHELVFKIEAVQWLRKPERGLRIAPGISDRTVERHIVTPLWPEKRKQKRTK
jgi:hypothetical protein